MINRKVILLTLTLAGTIFIGLSIVAGAANTILTPVNLTNGDSVTVNCPNGSIAISGQNSATALLKCSIIVPATATATAKPPATATATAAPTPTKPPVGTPGPGQPRQAPNGNSMAMGLWNPNPKFDMCYNADGSVNADATSRIKQLHESYSVIGPDGKLYPTWHPPVATDPITKASCRFGHEHGKDPSTFPYFNEIKQYYAYNGDVANSGIPFGYINDQLDVWTAANKSPISMRHEDHVGNKVEWEVNVPVSTSNPSQAGGKQPTGLTCNYFSAVHQGTSTHDAFQNNLHGVFYMSKCSDGQNLKLNKLVKFGPAGQFTRVCDAVGDRTTVIKTGFSYSNPAYPGTSQDGIRNITDRNCVINNFLVPSGKWSMNFYEAWSGNMNITGSQGQALVRNVDLLFDVENAVRYYNPGATHPELGADAAKYTDASFSMDLCYEVLPNGNKARGGGCDAATKSGSIKGITWDDPRSGFKGTNRGLYFKPGNTTNAGGPAVWYTDPFGENGSTTPFAGSIKQNVDQRNIDYNQKFGGATTFIVPEVINRSYENPTVHGPN
jgi:hypothetical protein